jgi:hypothetical protein
MWDRVGGLLNAASVAQACNSVLSGAAAKTEADCASRHKRVAWVVSQTWSNRELGAENVLPGTKRILRDPMRRVNLLELKWL